MTPDGPVDHLAIGVTADELDRLREAAPELGCRVDDSDPRDRIFVHDPFGVVWETSVTG